MHAKVSYSDTACRLRTAAIALTAGLLLAAPGTLLADQPPLPLGLLFVPPGLGSADTAERPDSGLSVLNSLASAEAAPTALPQAVERPDPNSSQQLAQATSRNRDEPRGGRPLSPRVTAPVQVVRPGRGETVLSRERPDLDPLGLPIGGLQAFPSLTVEGQVNDNVFRDDGGEKADFITTIRPRVAVRSDWPVHALTFDLNGAIGIYADNSSENFEDVRVGTGGRFDIDSETYIGAGANFQQLHEDRGSPDDVNGREPTEYNVLTGNAELFRRFGPIAATPKT